MKSTELIKKTYKGSFVLAINLFTFGLFFLRDILATRFFGLNSSMDSVYLGILAPTLLANLLYQPLSDYLVPKFQARLVQGLSAFQLYLNSVFYSALSGIILLFFFMLGRFIIADIIAHGFTLANKEIVAGYILTSLPIVFLGGMVVSTSIYLNSLGMYIFTAAAAAIVPILAIAYMYLYGHNFGVVSFIHGMILGQVLNLLILLIGVAKVKKNSGDSPKFKLIKIQKIQFFEYGSQNMVNLCFYGFGAIGASFGTNFQEGTTSIVIIVNKLINFFTNLFNATFSSVLMPYFSRVILGDKERFNREKRLFLYFVSFFGILSIALVYIFSGFIAKILFFSSKVSADQSLTFIRYVKLGSFQIPLLLSTILCFKWLTIQKKFRNLALFSFLAITLDILLNFILTKGVGVLSILLAPSITLACILMGVKYYMGNNQLGLTQKDFAIFSIIWASLVAVLLANTLF